MIYLFAGIVLGLLGWALRDEFRRDGSLFPLFDEARAEREKALATLIEFPLPDAWTADDVLRTYAEIEAL